MKEKKTTVITFRTEDWVKETLQEYAQQNKWSVAQTVETICKNFIADPFANEIIVSLADLIKIVDQLKNEGIDKGVRMYTVLEANEGKLELKKRMEFELLECGGNGCITGFEPIYQLNEEEILDIP